MPMINAETRGLVFFSRHYRERDALVKIFTADFGKRQFFVRNAGKSKLRSSLQAFTCASYAATINDDGFSFIQDAGDIKVYRHLESDLVANAHASYVMSLADAALPDNTADQALYDFLTSLLGLMDTGLDAAVLTNLFEIQILPRFGVALDLSECLICGRRDLPMDFSMVRDGCLCRDHLHLDPRRLHLDPNTLYLARQLQETSLGKLQSVAVSAERKQDLRDFLDELYDHYVGIKTRAKRFLDGMADWEGAMGAKEENDEK